MRQARLARVVLTPAASGHADFDPIGGAIGRARARGLDIGFHQPRFDAVFFLPIVHNPPRQLPQNVRGEVVDLHRGQDQKAAVAHNPCQMLGALGVVPAQPLITRPQSPSGGADRQAAEHAMALSAHQIADLTAAQWRSAAPVVGRHHRLPTLALRRAAANRLYRDRAQIGQPATDLRSGRTRCRGGPLRRPATRCRKLDITTPLKLDQMLAARHVLQSTAPILPPQPLTDLFGQPITRNARLRAARADPRRMICSRELLSRRGVTPPA